MTSRHPLSVLLSLGVFIVAGCGPHPAAQPPPASHGPLADAFLVAFGKPAPYATIDDSDDHVVFNPQALIDVAPGIVALVSNEEIPHGCRACAGALTISYLKRGPAGLSRMGSWPRVGGEGKWGAVLPWTVRTDLDDGPTLVTRRDEREAGCSATTTNSSPFGRPGR